MASILYKVSFSGNTGLCRAVSEDDAYEYMIRRIGKDNGPLDIEEANQDDQSWFKRMCGGYIYQTPAARREDKDDGKS